MTIHRRCPFILHPFSYHLCTLSCKLTAAGLFGTCTRFPLNVLCDKRKTTNTSIYIHICLMAGPHTKGRAKVLQLFGINKSKNE